MQQDPSNPRRLHLVPPLPPAPSVDEVADKLYADEPSSFIAARNDAVAEAKTAGDAALAAEIAKLRKPTVGAWLVNLLALQKPQLINDLLDLGQAMREAQRHLKGEELRQFANQRRKVIASLVAQAQALAGTTAGSTVGKLPLTEVEATLTAALSDADLAAQVRAGRVIKTVSYAGFGEMPTPDAEAQPPQRSQDKGPQRRKLEQAREAEAAARESATQAEAAEQAATGTLTEIEQRIEELEERRIAARQELNRLRSARKEAQRELTTAARRVAQAEAAMG